MRNCIGSKDQELNGSQKGTEMQPFSTSQPMPEEGEIRLLGCKIVMGEWVDTEGGVEKEIYEHFPSVFRTEGRTLMMWRSSESFQGKSLKKSTQI